MGKLVRSVEASPLCELGHKGSNLEDYSRAEYLQNKSFFAIRDEHKLAITHPGGSEPQRGFSGIGAESSAGLYRKGILKAQLTKDLRDSRVCDRPLNVD